MYQKLKLLYNTLKYIKFKQLYYQVFYKVKKRFLKKLPAHSISINTEILIWKTLIRHQNSLNDGKRRFTFLNLEKSFDTIDWNYSRYGKLWTYNLNYFDYLNQKNSSSDTGLKLINEFIRNEATLKDALESYPISLRGINWIKFLSENKIKDPIINGVLYNHYLRLFNNLEYHLLGNHLLENGFSLLFGAFYFKNQLFYKKAVQILKIELEEQILEDGGHFELSPMYHQILLFRLLDCIHLLQLNYWKNDYLLNHLHLKAKKMLGWLEVVTFKNGNIPMVNDSAYKIAPSSHQLFEYAKSIGLEWNETVLSDSGYRKFNTACYECFMDVGKIGPDYIPGHAHADTFNFELYIKEKPFIVDVGTSTYEKNEVRQLERSTISHNTVQVNDSNQSEVWSGFRVGKRAKIITFLENENEIIATHDGYKKFGVLHQRSFKNNSNKMIITDTLSGAKAKSTAYFHLHPTITSIKINENKVLYPELNVKMDFDGQNLKIEKSSYNYAIGFNQTQKATVIQVLFNKQLSISILIDS